MQSHMTYYMLFSRVNACPIVRFFHMTSSQRKTPPVHVTSHSECIFNAATRLALGSRNLYYNIIQPTITNRNSNSSNTATFGGDIFFKNFCSSRWSRPRRGSKPSPSTTYAVFLGSWERSMHSHTRMYTQKKKNEHAPGSTSATLCGSGSRRFRQQAPVIKSRSQRKETTKTKKKKKERASTCSEVTRHPGWPRVTW